jgi:hypothetical protein
LRLKEEVSHDLVRLALFDIVFFLDDSAPMRFDEDRIKELKLVLSNLALATRLFDRDGFSVRFMNSDVRGDNIRTEEQATALVDQVRFEGVTSLAASFRIITDGKVFTDGTSDIRPQLTTDSPPVMLMPSSKNTSMRSRIISEGGEVRPLL